jgi:glycosyltransferase involved in cell wall biosynthesis
MVISETMEPQPVAVVILTLDEEANLAAALESVKDWAGEVFVVDSFSVDRTPEIARSYRAVRFVQHAFEDYSSQWRWALENLPITQPWVLKLDADERLTEEFKAEAAAKM